MCMFSLFPIDYFTRAFLCDFVAAETTSFHSGMIILLIYSFYDLILGIEDPDVFIPPQECL